MAGYAYLDAFEPIDRILNPPEVEGKHCVLAPVARDVRAR